jgi:hypothetical protein
MRNRAYSYSWMKITRMEHLTNSKTVQTANANHLLKRGSKVVWRNSMLWRSHVSKQRNKLIRKSPNRFKCKSRLRNSSIKNKWWSNLHLNLKCRRESASESKRFKKCLRNRNTTIMCTCILSSSLYHRRWFITHSSNSIIFSSSHMLCSTRIHRRCLYTSNKCMIHLLCWPSNSTLSKASLNGTTSTTKKTYENSENKVATVSQMSFIRSQMTN